MSRWAIELARNTLNGYEADPESTIYDHGYVAVTQAAIDAARQIIERFPHNLGWVGVTGDGGIQVNVKNAWWIKEDEISGIHEHTYEIEIDKDGVISWNLTDEKTLYSILDKSLTNADHTLDETLSFLDERIEPYLDFGPG